MSFIQTIMMLDVNMFPESLEELNELLKDERTVKVGWTFVLIEILVYVTWLH